ncbi:MAG: site-specific integrase [Planctomycetes bacterium]|nr:site-specific integrase [Planctomycetota bacterium]
MPEANVPAPAASGDAHDCALAHARANPPETSLARAPARDAPESAVVAELLAAFLAGRRPGTQRAYAGALTAFGTWFGASAPPDALQALLRAPAGSANAVVYRYRGWLLDRGLSTATVGLHLSALRAVVRLARVQGLVAWNLEVPGVRREPYRDTRGPGRRGVRALLAEVEVAADPKALRDRAMVRLLTDLALRRAEVTAIDVEDVDLAAATVAVLGKGRTGKVKLKLPDATRDALAAWLAVRGPEPGAAFLNFTRGAGRRTRLTGTSLARIVRGLGAAAGIAGLHPHQLRHAAITEALDLTHGDVRAVQRFSRHADPRTLLLYDDARRDQGGEVAKLVADWR